MRLIWDEEKRQATLRDRNIDFAWAAKVFSGAHSTFADTRNDYGELRYITVGFVDGRMHMLAWTRRDDAIRVISMRKANDRETARFQKLFDGQ